MARLPSGAVYHVGEQIVTHLNRVLGPLNWSFHILDQGDESETDECWVFGQITVVIDGQTTVKQDYGSQAYKRSKKTGNYLCKWDDKKAAATDALKRAARLLGVGLDAWANERAPSWRPEDDTDTAPDAPKQPTKPSTETKPANMTQNTGAPVNGSVREPVDLNTPIEQTDGTISRARTCSATLDGGKVCGYKLYPGTTEEYMSKDGPKEFAVSELIARSLEEFQRIYCRPHFVGCLKAKREASAAKAS